VGIARRLRRAGQQQIAVGCDAGSREVALEGAVRIEQRGIDRGADGHRDIVGGEALQGLFGAGALQQEFRETAHIDEPGRLPTGAMLGGDRLEPVLGAERIADRALVLIPREIVRPLPAHFRAEEAPLAASRS
jgi:hypothetical protein